MSRSCFSSTLEAFRSSSRNIGGRAIVAHIVVNPFGYSMEELQLGQGNHSARNHSYRSTSYSGCVALLDGRV